MNDARIRQRPPRGLTTHSHSNAESANQLNARSASVLASGIRWRAALIGGSLIMLCASSQAASSIEAASNGDLGEVIVTAGLRQTLTDTLSASVSVIDSTQLHDSQAQHLEDVLGELPNVNWAGDSQRPRYFQIRGLGELEEYQGAPNPSVGILIDDMDFSGIGSIASLSDVDQLDVLRGPQGTRFGANALGGLIYIRTNAPSDILEARVSSGFGNYGTTNLSGTFNLPTEPAWLRLNVEQNQSNGFYENAYLHRDNTNARHETTLRVASHSQLSDSTSLDLHAIHANFNDGYDAWSPLGGRVTYSDQPGVDTQLSNGFSAHLTTQLTPHRSLEIIESRVDSQLVFSYDGDWGNSLFWAPFIDQFSETQRRHRLTQSTDIRLGSDDSNSQGWRVGFYNATLQESLNDLSVGMSDDPINGVYQQNLLTQSGFTSHSTAIYEQVDSSVASNWQLSSGLRLERHRADYQDSVVDAVNISTDSHHFAPSDNLWGGHISLTHRIDIGSLLASISRGYKASGFNLSAGLPGNALLYSAESDINAELGLNSHWLNNRLLWNTDVFWLTRNHAQIKSSYQSDPTNPNTFVFYTGNAQSATHRGLESNLTWAVNDQLSARAQLGLLRTQFTNFALLADQSQVVSRELAHAPHFSGSVAVTYRPKPPVYLQAEWSGMTKFFYDLPPNNTQSSGYALMHLTMGYQHNAWEVSFKVRNLFNKDYTVRGFYFGLVPPYYTPALYTQLGDPRLWMFSVSYRLGH